MGTLASQITSLTIVYSTVDSDVDQRKYQSSASLAFVWGIHRRPVNSPHKWPVTRKMFPFDDVIMAIRWWPLDLTDDKLTSASANGLMPSDPVYVAIWRHLTTTSYLKFGLGNRECNTWTNCKQNAVTLTKIIEITSTIWSFSILSNTRSCYWLLKFDGHLSLSEWPNYESIKYICIYIYIYIYTIEYVDISIKYMHNSLRPSDAYIPR